MPDKEAYASININKPLEQSGCRFFYTTESKATIQLGSFIIMDDWGEEPRHAKNNFNNFLPVEVHLHPTLPIKEFNQVNIQIKRQLPNCIKNYLPIDKFDS